MMEESQRDQPMTTTILANAAFVAAMAELPAFRDAGNDMDACYQFAVDAVGQQFTNDMGAFRFFYDMFCDGVAV
jgi:hypothetical protein